jgi:NAD(P)-dependent dehydrogenase (short-subunit alcohol dehydrogenase family)
LPTPQVPIGSGFTPASTASDVMRGVNLTGKVAIVTGGYSGIGRETARVLCDAGARVIVPARDLDRAQAAMAGIPGVEILPMDLVDPDSVDHFADWFRATGLPLHFLINSAGIMAVPELTRDARGHELHFATNHLGHFQLTRRLWPTLVKAQGARIVSVSSMGHRFSPVVFDDIDFERRPYDPWAAYGQSKTANILFAVALDERAQGEGIRAFALHPGGIVETGLVKHLSQDALRAAGALNADGSPIIDPAKGLKTVEQGAATQVWCAVSRQLDDMGGVYCENSDISPIWQEGGTEFSLDGPLNESGVKPYAIDRAAAAQLWTVSQQMLR